MIPYIDYAIIHVACKGNGRILSELILKSNSRIIIHPLTSIIFAAFEEMIKELSSDVHANKSSLVDSIRNDEEEVIDKIVDLWINHVANQKDTA